MLRVCWGGGRSLLGITSKLVNKLLIIIYEDFGRTREVVNPELLAVEQLGVDVV